MEDFQRGFFYGTDNDINVEVGWIPDRVEVFDFTLGTSYDVGYPSGQVLAFTSGGTNEIKAGHTLIGATSGARATVLQIMADTGTWAGGNAAGNIIIDADTLVGTFESENLYYDGSDTTNDAQTAAVQAEMGYDLAGTVASATDISAYLGSQGGNEKGFTYAAASNTDASMFVYSAFRRAGD